MKAVEKNGILTVLKTSRRVLQKKKKKKVASLYRKFHFFSEFTYETQGFTCLSTCKPKAKCRIELS